jgi:hypothetical protein
MQCGDDGCNKMAKVETKIGVHCVDIRGLKNLYKPVWGLCVLFLIVGFLTVGFWTDVRTTRAEIAKYEQVGRAALIKHEQGDNAEFFALSNRMSTIEGKYEVIIKMLGDIQKSNEEILKWQREHQ